MNTEDSEFERFEAEAKRRAAQPEQKPVAWMHPDGRIWTFGLGLDKSTFTVPLYTSPPASKPWVGLTQQEQASVLASVPTVPFEGDWHLALLTAIEAKLREKNA